MIAKLSKPLITPASCLPSDILNLLTSIEILDYGLGVQNSKQVYDKTWCNLSNPLVISYALAVISSGKANQVFLAGFDGYGSDDPRRIENDLVFKAHNDTKSAVPVLAVTPTSYNIDSTSIYAL